MSWTKFASKEKEKIYDVVAKNYSDENTARIFGMDSEKNSYFTEYDSDSDIIEKYFETLPELKKFLSDMWKKEEQELDEMTLFCAIAAFKGRDFIFAEGQQNTLPDKKEENDFELPDYIYRF